MAGKTNIPHNDLWMWAMARNPPGIIWDGLRGRNEWRAEQEIQPPFFDATGRYAGTMTAMDASIAKMFVNEASIRVTNQAMQLADGRYIV